ncbi:DUF3955 domain-containing protein [Clostridium paraputrificum]|uniref:DUF3955 domain-containing protein n=1 Tax=Clostridium TaxID=1485 RepID=UPI003D344A80
MDFGKQIKQLRLERNLTQEQMAKKLNISRQAISNWENNKNLPDLEMIITISKVFSLSLDKLILGGDSMTNMSEKLIRDGSETRRAKINLISLGIGAILLCIGVACIFLKSVSVEYIDAEGFLHENFFLLPIGFSFIFSSLVTFSVVGIKSIIDRIKNK